MTCPDLGEYKISVADPSPWLHGKIFIRIKSSHIRKSDSKEKKDKSIRLDDVVSRVEATSRMSKHEDQYDLSESTTNAPPALPLIPLANESLSRGYRPAQESHHPVRLLSG